MSEENKLKTGSDIYGDIEIISNFDASREEMIGYVRYVDGKEGGLENIQSITLTLDGDNVKISYDVIHQKFDRIRRITGYLAGTTDRWNNAKQSEEADRVKHL